MEVLDFRPDDFDGSNLKRPGIFAAMFTAEWCYFCKIFKPKFLKSVSEADLQPAMIDLTEMENPLWEVFDVQVIPSVAVFRNGKIVARKNGRLGIGLSGEEIDSLFEDFRKQTKA
jgi:thiol-disulfide isomerase/thioredoxin